jgi:hypothetical protein
MNETISQQMLQDLKLAVGRAHGVALGDVGAWLDGREELALAGFWDPRARRPRTFAGVVDATGQRLSWWEVSSLREAA